MKITLILFKYFFRIQKFQNFEGIKILQDLSILQFNQFILLKYHIQRINYHKLVNLTIILLQF